MNKYEYSVIEVAKKIKESVCGSHDIPYNMDELAHWLNWRVTEAWEPSTSKSYEDYDNAVRALAEKSVQVWMVSKFSVVIFPATDERIISETTNDIH